MSEAVDVEVRGLSKAYGNNNVLDDISFRVPAGTTLSLLGPSGCGKSTTLSILAGITDPKSGEVFFGGRPMNGVAMHRRGVGVVFQSYALFPHLTVQRNIEFGPRVQGKSKANWAAAADRSMALTHLTEFRDRLPRQLSGGQRQRVAIARALASSPQVLLMDEPLSSLDAKLREEMQFEISDLQKKTGISMIFVTHDQREAMAVGDQLGVLFEGRMRQVGSGTDLYDRPADLDVARFLGKANLLPVTVGRLDGDHTEVVSANGDRWVATLRGGTTLDAGGPALLMIRPESLRIVEEPSGSPVTNRISGVVVRATFLGREADAVVDVGFAHLEMRCNVEESQRLRPGLGVDLTWSSARGSLFPRPVGWVETAPSGG